MAHRASLNTLRLASVFASAAAIAIVVQQALMEYAPPVRCGPGLVPQAARCCGGGQVWFNGRCEGRVTSCGPGQVGLEVDGEASDCVFDAAPVELPGGHLPQGAADFQLEGVTGSLDIRPFSIDRGEVTVYRYNECVRREVCSGPLIDKEPGLPVTGVPPTAAEAFCAFVGGRLPKAEEWRFAASGLEGRRFPWGFTGLVCRRAVFGLVSGPCSQNGTGPDLVGSRPDGNTAQGITDLAGNVAEWVKELNGGYRARGGSFRSRVAVELLTASVETKAPNAPEVGFRCVYPEEDDETAGGPR